jgi:hypothetical protein
MTLWRVKTSAYVGRGKTGLGLEEDLVAKDWSWNFAMDPEDVGRRREELCSW